MSVVARALGRALLARAGAEAALVRHDLRAWASLTFEGERHSLALALPVPAAERFAAGLEAAEIALPGHILADLAIDGRADGADGRCRLDLTALTLADR